MKSFQYHIPTFIAFGTDAHEMIGQLAKNLEAKRALIVYGSERLEQTGIIGYLSDRLQEQGIESMRIGGVHPNPRYLQTLEMAKKAAAFDPELVIAAGGGSVIDASKAIALYLNNQDKDLWQIWTGQVQPERARAVGAVLTIPAAGSETSDSAVLTHEELQTKRGFSHSSLRPLFAIMNPALAVSVPPKQAAAGVCDILMHTLDRYFTHDEDNALTDEIAEAVLRNTLRFGKTYAAHPDDLQAGSEIMWAGSLSHNNLTGLGRVKDFSVHQLGHELSAMFDMTHGGSLAIMFPAWARYVLPLAPARFARLARNVLGIQEADDLKAAQMGIDALEQYFSDMGLPASLREALPHVEFDEAVLNQLASGCSRQGTRTIGLYLPLDEIRMKEVYARAVSGSHASEQ